MNVQTQTRTTQTWRRLVTPRNAMGAFLALAILVMAIGTVAPIAQPQQSPAQAQAQELDPSTVEEVQTGPIEQSTTGTQPGEDDDTDTRLGASMSSMPAVLLGGDGMISMIFPVEPQAAPQSRNPSHMYMGSDLCPGTWNGRNLLNWVKPDRPGDRTLTYNNEPVLQICAYGEGEPSGNKSGLTSVVATASGKYEIGTATIQVGPNNYPDMLVVRHTTAALKYSEQETACVVLMSSLEDNRQAFIAGRTIVPYSIGPCDR